MTKLKKSLGQHFLIDESISIRIVDALQKHKFSHLLEVGPGGGALTKYLLGISKVDFKAVELDAEKITKLEKRYPQLRGQIIHADFLSLTPPFEEEFALIGNFPYNISTQILFKVVEWKELVPVVIGMFQKEVAERAAANPGGKIFGVLSVLIQYYYDVEYLFDVSNKAFVPPPKVQSGVIRLTRREELLPVKSERAFRTLVKSSFSQRRKTLRNSARAFFSKEILSDKIFDRRPETLTVKEFTELTFRMS